MTARQAGSVRTRAQQGFTLLELVVAVAIGILVIALGSAAVGQAFRASKVWTQASALQELIGAAATVRSANGYPARLIPSLRSGGLIPGDFHDPGGDTLTHQWGGAIHFTSSGNNDLVLRLEALPPTACAALARRLATSDRYVVDAGGQLIPAGDIAAAAAACANDPSTLRLTINS